MAFTVTARQSGNAQQVSAQTLTTSSTTPTANSLLLLFFGAENDNHSTAAAFTVAPTGGGWTYTQHDKKGDATAYEWNGTTGFRQASALYSAEIGASPGAHTIVVDAYTSTNAGFYGAIACDVTGHNAGAPIVNTSNNGANIPTASDSAAGTVVLDQTPITGNLVVVWFYASADSGGSVASPTAGVGKTFTTITNQSTTGFTTAGAFHRTWDGSESNTITCADLGTQVGAYTAIAVEIAIDAGPPPPQPTLWVNRSPRHMAGRAHNR